MQSCQSLTKSEKLPTRLAKRPVDEECVSSRIVKRVRLDPHSTDLIPKVEPSRVSSGLMLIRAIDLSKSVYSPLICPISMAPFINPVILPSGRTYEKSDLFKSLLKGTFRDPMTRESLHFNHIRSNKDLASLMNGEGGTSSIKASELSKILNPDIIDPITQSANEKTQQTEVLLKAYSDALISLKEFSDFE